MLPWQLCIRHSLWWQPPTSRCTRAHTYAHSKLEHEHLKSPHIKGGHTDLPTAILNQHIFPDDPCTQVCVVVRGWRGNAFAEQQKVKLSEDNNIAISQQQQNTMNDCDDIPERCHQVPSEGDSFLRMTHLAFEPHCYFTLQENVRNDTAHVHVSQPSG